MSQYQLAILFSWILLFYLWCKIWKGSEIIGQYYSLKLLELFYCSIMILDLFILSLFSFYPQFDIIWLSWLTPIQNCYHMGTAGNNHNIRPIAMQYFVATIWIHKELGGGQVLCYKIDTNISFLSTPDIVTGCGRDGGWNRGSAS